MLQLSDTGFILLFQYTLYVAAYSRIGVALCIEKQRLRRDALCTPFASLALSANPTYPCLALMLTDFGICFYFLLLHLLDEAATQKHLRAGPVFHSKRTHSVTLSS